MALLTTSFSSLANMNAAASEVDSLTTFSSSFNNAIDNIARIGDGFFVVYSQSASAISGAVSGVNFSIFGSFSSFPATISSIVLTDSLYKFSAFGNVVIANENADATGSINRFVIEDTLAHTKVTLTASYDIASDVVSSISSFQLEANGIKLLMKGSFAEDNSVIGINGFISSISLTSLSENVTLSNLHISVTEFETYDTFSDFLSNTLRANDTISGTSSSEVLFGFAGADNLKALGGVDTVNGGDGNDTLDGGVGADDLIGGAGNDTYIVDNVNDVITELDNQGVDSVNVNVANGATYTLSNYLEKATLSNAWATNLVGNDQGDNLIGNAAVNIITGGAGNDTLVGGAGNDTLNGRAGDDSIDGGLGIDSMVGGIGDDVYLVDNVADKAVELGDEGADTVKSSVSHTLASNVENLTLTGAAVVNGTGNGLENVITGNAAANRLNGGGGVDALVGAAGNDTLDGGAGVDSMDGGAGNDTYVVDDSFDIVTELLSGAAGGVDTVQSSLDFTLIENVENLTLSGTENLFGYGSSAANTILGNTGNNDLTGAGGVDVLKGGAGNDRYFVDLISVGIGAAAKVVLQDSVTENTNEGNDTLLLTGGTITLTNATTLTLGTNLENLDTFFTGSTKLNLTGNALNNQLIGNDANNILNGGVGADDLKGRAGDDVYFVDSILDTVTEYFDQPGTDLVNSSVTFTLDDFVENLTLTGSANINGTGNDLDNIIIGNVGNNSLSGGAGADTLNGGAGNDTYLVDDVGDVIVDSAGIDTVISSVNYTLALGQENLILTGSADVKATGNAAANYITGNSGYNVLLGGAGNDTLDGGISTAFSDVLNGGSGNDTYIVDDLTDIIVEESALTMEVDTIKSSVSLGLSSYTNIENLTLTGSDDINAFGSDIANVLIGNIGDNQLSGLGGIDTLQGGKGDDTYFVDLVAISNAANATLKIQDTIIENTNEGSADSIVVIAGAFSGNSLSTFTIGANIEKLWLDAAVDIKLNAVGNALNNYITGNNLANKIDGGIGNDDIYGNDGNDTLIGGVGNDNLNGNVGNDSLNGGAGNDILDGDTGLDVLVGGAGNDVYILNDENDTTEDIIIELSGAEGGIDTIKTTFNYSLVDTDGVGLNGGNVENLTLLDSDDINGTGNALANNITGNVGNNSLKGGAGNDTLTGGIGSDLLDGGIGNDTYLLVDVNDLLDTIVENSTIDSGTDTVKTIFNGYTLGANLENLVLLGVNDIGGSGNALKNTVTGNNYNNNLNGLDGNDTLIGGLGNDTLNGGAGKDSLIGGAGNDTYLVDLLLTGTSLANYKLALEDTISESVNAGTDTLVLSGAAPRGLAFTLNANIENLDASLVTGTISNTTRGIALIGNALNNDITGNDESNEINGGAGNDTLRGGLGEDQLDGGAGADVLIGGAGSDSYILTDKLDTIIDDGLTGEDIIYASFSLDLNDYVGIESAILSLNNALNFNLTGNSLNNSLVGNGGNNVIDAGDGNDYLNGNTGNDTLYGRIGNDTLLGFTGNDYLDGGDGNDFLIGDDVSGILYTPTIVVKGNDILMGGAGSDTLDGGLGADRLTGGADADVFRFNVVTESTVGVNHDVITDFSTGVDQLDFSTIDANSKLVDNQAFTFLGVDADFTHVPGQLRFDSGSHMLFGDVDGNGLAEFQIQLLGVTTMDAADFVL